MKHTLNKIPFSALIAMLAACMLTACNKTKVDPIDPYPEAPKPLVKFLDGAPTPATGIEGSVVAFNLNGLKGKEGTFKFFINQTEAEVVSVEENTVRVKVPLNASTGGSSVLINGEYYFGPTFTVKGKISVDPLFNADSYRSTGPINGIFRRADGTTYMVYGSFNNYQNMASTTVTISGIAVLGANGEYAAAASQLKVGKAGFNSMVSKVIQLASGKYLVAGYFNRYDTMSNVNNMARLNADGTLETMVVDVVNPDPINFPNNDKDVVPGFNGGTLGGIGNLFYNATTAKATVTGNFSYHVSTFYERSTKGGPYLDQTKARQIIRMNDNGSFDSTFNFDRTLNSSYAGANGNIYDAIQQADGKIIVVGNFTTFNGKPAKYIARISATDGTLDETFNMGNVGADGSINKITFNATTGKILLSGGFKNYNGVAAGGVVMIGANGAVDASFNFKLLEGGVVNYAGQINNGKILVSGSFNKYAGVVRPGLLVLNADGTLAAGYNNIGLFRGTISSFVELTSSNGMPAIIIVGSFDRFDGKEVANIVKFRIEN
ncbi:MAG: DUF5008 domain-containing protein [Bacteroidota bacterium]